MNSGDWEKIEEIVSEAISLVGQKRREFITGRCRDMPELRKEIEALLEIENEADDFFDSPAALKFSRFLEDEKAEVSIGQQIGIYRIEREIGMGGMGAVYLATRTDGEFDRQVGIKMLRREFNTAKIRRRFEYEKDIQAALNHPNIARLLDAGTTDDGIPYLVMEYIEGENISVFCHRNAFSLEQRLELFRKVCGAVAFAHRNLVVHRDLKPSNIIVSKDGEPKLLDFGISKLLTADSDQTQTVTKLGVMTPEYASPEQVKGKSVTTATDIYSLGVILFELLTGQKPFAKELKDSGNLLKAIIENEPEKPSSVLGQDQSLKIPKVQTVEYQNRERDLTDPFATEVLEVNKTKSLISKTKPLSGIKNPKRLKGDLDNIILKSLRKEPERRYQTVEQFSEDIRRHLDGLPVSARPATFVYRASKFVNRNKVAVFSGILILLTVIVGSLATLWQARLAEARFNEVRKIANSFLFEITPEIEKLPGSTKAKELVVKRALEYLDNLSKSAAGDAELQRELAVAYEKVGSVQGNPAQNNLGDIEGAEKSYEKAKMILENLLTNDLNNLQLETDLADVLNLLGDLKFFADDLDKAEEYLSISFELRKKIANAEPGEIEAQKNLGEIINDLGKIAFWKGNLKKAWENHEKARIIFEKLYRENPADYKIAEDTAYTYILLGYILGWEEKFTESGEFLEKALEMMKEIVKKHPQDLQVRRTLMLAYTRRAENFTDLEQFDKSLELYKEGEKIAETASQEDPDNSRAKRDLVILKFKVAEVLNLGGKTEAGLEKLNEVLKIQKQIASVEPNNAGHIYDIGKTQNTIGEAHLKLKNYDKAMEIFETALGNFNKTIEKDPKNTIAIRAKGVTKQNIGKTYHALADSKKQTILYKKALENYKESLSILNKLKSDNTLADQDYKLLTELEKQIIEVQNKP